MAKKLPLVILQGATFHVPIYWYAGADVIKTITAVTRGYPTLLTVTAHGLPAGDTPVTVLGVTGAPVILNSESELPADRSYATYIDANTLSLDVNTTGLAAPTVAGFLKLTPPVDLAGYTARMKVKTSYSATAALVSLTTENGGITLSAFALVEVDITATDTAALSFTAAVYDLELMSATGVVTRLTYGPVTLSKEITKGTP